MEVHHGARRPPIADPRRTRPEFRQPPIDGRRLHGGRWGPMLGIQTALPTARMSVVEDDLDSASARS